MGETGHIVSCSSRYFSLPRHLWWPFQPPSRQLPQDSITLVTCELETDAGVRGLGLTISFGRGGAPVRATIEHEFAPHLLGLDVSSPPVIFDRLLPLTRRLGLGGVPSMALSAVDIAVWDAAAKAAGKPLFRLLGARREKIPAYGSSLDRLYSDEEFVATVEEYRQRGMQAVKVRVGLGIAADLRRLELLRDTVGPHFRIMVDANANWDLPEALRRLRQLEQFQLDWLEEPIDPDDADGFAELQSHTTIPIAGGENLYTLGAVARFVGRGALRVVQPDVCRIGGVTGWLRAADLANVAGLPVTSHLAQDISVHVLCAAPNATLLEYLPLLDPLLESPLVVGPDGSIAPPERPGTGLQLRSELIEPFLVA